MKPKSKRYTNEQVLNAVNIGIEFEFYSKLKDIEIARSIGNEIDKRIVVPFSVTMVDGEQRPVYHSPIKVTEEIFKLEPDYSGGAGMYELITGPLPLKEARTIITKVLAWLDRYGYTNDRCSIHVNISFNDTIETVNSIENMEVLKFVLSFNEKPVYKSFPTRKYSVYARSINTIIPNSFFFYKDIPADWSVMSNMTVPEEKYYGVNFTKRKDGYLEFRYMGGKDYEKKPDIILNTIDYFALELYKVLNSTGYNKVEKSKLKKIIEEHAVIVDCFSDYNKFKDTFKDIEVAIDLQRNDQIIKTFWARIREPLFDLMVKSGFKKGKFNLDTDFGTLQLANANLKSARLNGYELVQCEIEGVVNDCKLYFCNVNHSRVRKCECIKSNIIENSKVEETALYESNKLEGCYIDNSPSIVPINCEVIGGVIRRGMIGEYAEISEKTLNVEADLKKKKKKSSLINKK